MVVQITSSDIKLKVSKSINFCNPNVLSNNLNLVPPFSRSSEKKKYHILILQ